MVFWDTLYIFLPAQIKLSSSSKYSPNLVPLQKFLKKFMLVGKLLVIFIESNLRLKEKHKCISLKCNALDYSYLSSENQLTLNHFHTDHFQQ